MTVQEISIYDEPRPEKTKARKVTADVMITLQACPRCGGAVLDYRSPIADSPLCITCGWRRPEVPPNIQAEVEAHLGKSFMEDHYKHKQIGTGKPPLSGWEREKRRRLKEKKSTEPKVAVG